MRTMDSYFHNCMPERRFAWSGLNYYITSTAVCGLQHFFSARLRISAGE
jgi:hypothetical protein